MKAAGGKLETVQSNNYHARSMGIHAVPMQREQGLFLGAALRHMHAPARDSRLHMAHVFWVEATRALV